MSLTSEEQQFIDEVGKDAVLARDYSGIVDWSVNKLATWCPQWTDYTITDPGILFINAKAYIYDQINYKLDKTYLNNILRLTSSKEHLYFMGIFVGLDIPGVQAATVNVRIENTSEYKVLLRRGTKFFINDKALGKDLNFSLKEDVTIYAGNSVKVDLIEGLPVEKFIYKEALSDNLTYMVYGDNVAENSFRVFIDGVEIPKVEDAFLNVLTTLCFSAHFAFDGVVVKFPPGSKKELSNSQIEIFYTDSSGQAGNLGNVQLRLNEDLLVDDLDISDKLLISVISAEGGKDLLDLEEERCFIGDNTWRVDTLVNEADFASLVDKVDGLIRLFPVFQENTSEIAVYYLEDSSYDSSLIEEKIIDLLEGNLIGFATFQLSKVGRRKLSLNLEVTLKNNISDVSLIESKIKRVLDRELNILQQPSFYTFQRRYITSLLEREIEEIYYVAITSPTTDIDSPETEVLVLDSLQMKFFKRVGGNVANVRFL